MYTSPRLGLQMLRHYQQLTYRLYLLSTLTCYRDKSIASNVEKHYSRDDMSRLSDCNTCGVDGEYRWRGVWCDW